VQFSIYTFVSFTQIHNLQKFISQITMSYIKRYIIKYLCIHFQILTKEILNRTELQECIAENINKAIIPTDLSLKDENLNESMIGEGNTSIMSEINNAIKSIVEATESDPVFEKFLDEIIGPHTETDTSPEEDGEGKLSPKSVNEYVYIFYLLNILL